MTYQTSLKRPCMNLWYLPGFSVLNSDSAAMFWRYISMNKLLLKSPASKRTLR